MANNTDLSKTRNDFQQYDLVTVFQASETRIMRHLHVATMAVVTKIDGDTLQCMPFPIRENTTANNIYAFNIGKVDYKVGDKVLVIFTDRDFRKNYDSATTSERTIGKTNDALLHSIDYGVVMPMTKAYEGSIEALKEKLDKHINDFGNPHDVTKAQVGLENVVNQGMDVVPTKSSEKYISSGGVYDYVEAFRIDLNALSEAINQIEKDYATKDYVVGNFANKYDTNKAIESVSTKATSNETEINNIKNDYLTKASADSTYAKSSDVNKSIDGLNTSVSNVAKSVTDINTSIDSVNSSIGNINVTLATKQDNLSFGNGINNTNNLVTIDFSKVQAKVSADNGILFSNNVLSIDTSIIPTIEYINSLGYAKASDIPTKVSQLTNDSGYVTESYVNTNFATIDSTNKAIDSLSNSIQSNASAIESIKTDYATNEYVNSTFANAAKTDKAIDNLGSRMTTAENNISGRYTKGEVDAKTEDKMKIISPTRKYHFDGGGNYRFCKVATITAIATWANRPIVFEAIGRGMNYCQLISIYPNGSPSASGTTYTNIYKRTNDLYWVMKDEGNGVCSLYVMLSEVWGDLEITRVFYDGAYFSVEMKMEAVSAFPNGAIEAKNIITASTADEATHATNADSADKATTMYMPRKYGMTPDSMTDDLAIERTRVLETNSGTTIGGLGLPWWHIFTNQSQDPAYTTQLAVAMANARTPYLAFRNREGGTWCDWAVAITDKTIGQQTVKSFTATEIDHGDKFNGDLSSTTCSSAPMMVTTGKLTASSANEPNATKTAKTRDIRIGGTTKTITCPMNPFMEYFFDHGYHFDTESTSSSYECDAGFVVYEETLYYCVFSYKDSANNGFVTYPVSLENNVARLQSTPIAVSNSKSGISFSYDEIKAVGSLYECLGTDKNKAYNVYLVLDSRPPIPLTFNEKAKDFLTADGDSCLDFPSMKGVIYETY